MGALVAFLIGYFLLQVAFFWWLIDRAWPRRMRVAAALAAIGLLPSLMYLETLYREFGDGGAVATVLAVLVFIGGFVTLMIVMILRAVITQYFA
jgi:hypothetical protein